MCGDFNVTCGLCNFLPFVVNIAVLKVFTRILGTKILLEIRGTLNVCKQELRV